MARIVHALDNQQLHSDVIAAIDAAIANHGNHLEFRIGIVPSHVSGETAGLSRMEVYAPRVVMRRVDTCLFQVPYDCAPVAE